jgi:acyl-CoA thioesterase FadM
MDERDIPHFPLTLPRNAFNLREVARAGDLWRACQDIAIDASTRAGWPPSRYVKERTAYVMRSMVCVHRREISHGDTLRTQTWVSKIKRELISMREIRILVEDERGALQPVIDATQEWVHVSADLKLMRKPKALLDAIVAIAGTRTIDFPEFAPIDLGRESHFAFDCWQTWSDPLGHVNHPVYVDWADEAVARAVKHAGLTPSNVVPIAETVTYRKGVSPGMPVEIRSRVVGTTAEGVVMTHTMSDDKQDIYAEATTIRKVLGVDADVLVNALI